MYYESKKEQMMETAAVCSAEDRNLKRFRMAAVWMMGIILFLSVFAVRNTQAATYRESDYKLVYDYSYYINKYPYLKKKFKTRAAVLKRFVEYGMNHAARGKLKFNVRTYRSN
ncbi:MAG: hypothetical protein J6E44_00140, partial [Lachnospiraceae bacterium]|nr:hypothetical protein [Lachnospiraceae bacterium]